MLSDRCGRPRLNGAICPAPTPSDGRSTANAPAANASDNARADAVAGPRGAAAASAGDGAASGNAAPPMAAGRTAVDQMRADQMRAGRMAARSVPPRARARSVVKPAALPRAPAEPPAAPEPDRADRPARPARRPIWLFVAALQYSVSGAFAPLSGRRPTIEPGAAANKMFPIDNRGSRAPRPIPWFRPWPAPAPFAWPPRARRPGRAWPARC